MTKMVTTVVVPSAIGSHYYLPTEVLMHIFGFLDPRTLVFVCRSVCKFWNNTVQSSKLWRTQIICNTTDDDIVKRALPTNAKVPYPWYTCYAICKNIFGKNLFPRDIPSGRPARLWDDDSSNAGIIYATAVGAFHLGFQQIPQQLINEGVSTCLLSSVGECSVNHTIDLYAHGFTKKILELQPPIHVSEWFSVRYNFVGLYCLDVLLFNSHWKGDYEHGRFQYKVRSARLEWHNVTHTFVNYRPDVRYITFNHGVDIFLPPTPRAFREIDSREPAAKMAGAKVSVCLPALDRSTDEDE